MTATAPPETRQWAPDDLLTPPEAAAVIRFTAGTLKKMRSLGTGPKYRKHGSRVLYRYGDLMEWSEARAHG